MERRKREYMALRNVELQGLVDNETFKPVHRSEFQNDSRVWLKIHRYLEASRPRDENEEPTSCPKQRRRIEIKLNKFNNNKEILAKDSIDHSPVNTRERKLHATFHPGLHKKRNQTLSRGILSATLGDGISRKHRIEGDETILRQIRERPTLVPYVLTAPFRPNRDAKVDNRPISLRQTR